MHVNLFEASTIRRGCKVADPGRFGFEQFPADGKIQPKRYKCVRTGERTRAGAAFRQRHYHSGRYGSAPSGSSMRAPYCLR